MSAHTPEPWTVGQKHPTRIISTTGNESIGFTALFQDEGFETDTMKANAARIVACVNGCTGLNPAAYRECVEALRAAQIALQQATFTKMDATGDHAKRIVREALTAATGSAS